MNEKIAFLYAGQGSQKTGMGQDFYETFLEFKSIFDSISLDFDIKEACFLNPDNILIKTQYTQPCMVAVACGITEVLYSKGIIPNYVCGLSLGEYSALYAAGVWSLNDTMKIISTRGKAMAEASQRIESAMAAINSLSVEAVKECCDKASNFGIVSICNLNCPGQVVVGGERSAVERMIQFAKEAGAKRCVPLAVSGPFHTKYMKPAAEKLEKVFQSIIFNEPRYEVLYNYLGGPKESSLSIPELLVRQIQHTVRMHDCIKYLINNNVKVFIEVGPGTALSGFVKKTLKSLNRDIDEYRIFSINEIEDIKVLESALTCSIL